MQYDEFVSLVERRARVDTEEEALCAAEATLKTLAERIEEREAADLAAQLPHPIGGYLTEEKVHKKFGLEEFYEHVSERESIGFPEVERHARAVISVVSEAVEPGEIRDVLDQLPAEYLPLFTFGAGDEYRSL